MAARRRLGGKVWAFVLLAVLMLPLVPAQASAEAAQPEASEDQAAELSSFGTQDKEFSVAGLRAAEDDRYADGSEDDRYDNGSEDDRYADGSYDESQRISLEGAKVVFPRVQYSGDPQRPDPTVTLNGTTLTSGVDFEVGLDGEDPTDAGTYRVAVVGIGAYRGAAEGTLVISPAAITSVSVAAQAYTGSAVKPVPVVKAGSGTVPSDGFKVTYKNNAKVGTATLTVVGTGNYTGTKTARFKIKKTSASKFSVSSIGKKKYTGRAIKPKPTVRYKGKKLRRGTDYTLSYKGNVKAGTARVVIKGKGGFTGTKTVKFQIVKPKASKAKASKAKAKAKASKAASKAKASKAKPKAQSTRSSTVYITDTGKKYHRDGCSSLRRSKHAISLSDAKRRGYSACAVCKP